ncbi:hypothetical protein NVP1037O_02 [Vibrio phage 1.037.O._10N.261.52.F7]|nr:hypothetical protein NVP1037O_02 [Vibrio phage 1.037.O._10N.261.52.F7]
MACNYGGRLGEIMKAFPQVSCPCCQTKQVQITSYLSGNPLYKCRKCKQVFELEFKGETPPPPEPPNGIRLRPYL